MSECDKFWELVHKTESCWIWIGRINWAGYGIIDLKRDGKWVNLRAHRFSWELNYGIKLGGSSVLHKCDNRKCVNPEHLFLGSHKDNMKDMVGKGRSARGSKNAKSKISEADVKIIRMLICIGSELNQIADWYHIKPQTVSLIKRRLIWKHV